MSHVPPLPTPAYCCCENRPSYEEGNICYAADCCISSRLCVSLTLIIMIHTIMLPIWLRSLPGVVLLEYLYSWF